MNDKNFKDLSAIIERDSKDTTYKYALLRAVIEIVQEYDHLSVEKEQRMHFPLGLLVEKWLLFYYPIFESSVFIPQKNGETEDRQPGKVIAFRLLFEELTLYYRDKGGFSAFYNDYRNGTIPEEANDLFLKLTHRIKHTITRMPMRYLGNSVFKSDYSIFHFESGHRRRDIRPQSIDPEYLINNFGSFSFSKELYVVFRYLGSFIAGTDSILFKWAEFSVNADKTGRLQLENVINEILKFPQTDRDVYEARRFFDNQLHSSGKLYCVWSGKTLNKASELHIDHLIPFSLWKNNDLWNLLPAHPTINSRKRDRIPTIELIEKRQDIIIGYWEKLRQNYSQRFDRELRISLTGSASSNFWQKAAIHQFQEKCRFLIEIRGSETWEV